MKIIIGFAIIAIVATVWLMVVVGDDGKYNDTDDDEIFERWGDDGKK